MDQQSVSNASRTNIKHQISNGLNDLNAPDEVRVSCREPRHKVWNNLEDTDFYDQQSLKMKSLCCFVVMKALKKPSLEKSEKAVQKAIIKSLLNVISDTNPSEYHNPSDSNSNVAQNVVVNMAESAPVETQRDHLSEDEESQKSDATLDVEDCAKEELTDLSGGSATSAMHEYLEGPTVEAIADDESGSVHADHSGCNTETTAYAQVPAKGVQPMPMHTSEGVQVPQQEEAGNDGAAGDGSVAPNPSTAIPGVMVLNSLSSSMSINARNMVGLPTCTLYSGKVKEQHKNVPVDEDSDERQKKAMDQLRKEGEERVKQTTDAVKKTSDISHAAPKGLVLLSNAPHIFQKGAYVPLPSQEAMAKTIGKGGNGVVAYIYHGRKEFAVKETGLRQEELETWSSVNHCNVIELCAVIEGDWDSACCKTRRCYQMMPRMTGDLKSLLGKERPTLCHYFFDFKGDSEGMNLVLGNAKYILLGVLNGLKHLHSLGIMHRDIKLQNILVDRHCQCREIFLCPHDGDSGYGVFISDFDSARQVERGREKLERTKCYGRRIKYSVHGTPGYRPPETSFSMSCNEVLPEWVSLKTDIWSFGAMVVKLFVGSRGPHSQREMATLLLSDCLQSPTAAQRPEGVKTSPLRQVLAVRPDEIKKLTKVALLEKYFPQAGDLYQLVQSCLTVNSEERPTVGQVMEEPFFGAFKGSESMSTSAEERGRGVGDCQTTSVKVGPSYEGESQSPISRYNCTQKPMVQDS